MKDDYRSIINYCQDQGVHYSEVRFQKTNHTLLQVRNGVLTNIKEGIDAGVGIRILFNNAWSFSSTNAFTKRGLLKAAKDAIRIAKARNTNDQRKITLAYEDLDCETTSSEVKKSVYALTLEQNLREMQRLDSMIMSCDKRVSDRAITCECHDEYRIFQNSLGADIRVPLARVLIRMSIRAREMGRSGTVTDAVGGPPDDRIWERAVETGQRIAKSAVILLGAKSSPSGFFPVILDNSCTGTLVHEAFGHMTEADFIISGTSSLRGMLGNQIAALCVSIVDDATLKETFGYLPFDDEGIRGKKTTLVSKGVLTSYLHNRETAAIFRVNPTGNARAQDYRHEPLIRMRTTYMERGSTSLEEMFRDVDYGIYATRASVGKANLTGAFRIYAQEAFLIKKGNITEPLGSVVLSGETVETLRNIDAVSKDFEVFSGPCVKTQTIPVGDGGPQVKIKRMRVENLSCTL